LSSASILLFQNLVCTAHVSSIRLIKLVKKTTFSQGFLPRSVHMTILRQGVTLTTQTVMYRWRSKVVQSKYWTSFLSVWFI